ncbi:Vps52p [Sugiyamaella lignohabitans]|uniref:Vps52p n=1 Tax=Sugiyamaella lignohabitans TaxID=796027 RepID=A0A167DI58_9ASCO|nr:Vps52p [Sugiyamaella lignohabitans]ANB12944.1 Vps52p [Sugiyamaella lignohabitans]
MSVVGNRVASRSISRPSPSGSKESTVDVLLQLNDILSINLADLVPQLDLVVPSISGTTNESASEQTKKAEGGSSTEKTQEVEDIDDKEKERSDSSGLTETTLPINSFNSLEEIVAEGAKQQSQKETKLDAESYHKEIGKFQSLHEELVTSQKTLDVLETSLKTFKSNLNALSADMELLQNRSLDHAQRLQLRKQAEIKLAPLVEALIIPPSIVLQISEKEISPQWRAALKYLVRRKSELESLKSSGEKFTAIEGAEAQLTLVTKKAIERIRDYLVNHIRSLRSPGVNAQAIQGDLLANKDLYKFLFKEYEKLALDLRQAYIYTMRWYYSSNFSRYVKSLEKLPMYTVEHSILLGSDEPIRKGLFSGATATSSAFSSLYGGGGSPRSSSGSTATFAGSATVNSASRAPTDYLTIGDRANIIFSDDPSVITSHVAEHSHLTTSIETGFRSFNITLIDNASVEFMFVSEFFQYQKGETASAIFNAIFEPTLHIGHAYTKFLLDGSYDAYGMLICIRLCRKLELELQHRKIPVVQDYFNLQLINLWPRFQIVMDAHSDSLRRASTKSSAFSATKSNSSSLVPHHITQQFASFLYGILSLCEDDESGTEPVVNSITRLRNDFESFLTKMSGTLNDSTAKQEKFLYNNYFLVSTIISVSFHHICLFRFFGTSCTRQMSLPHTDAGAFGINNCKP